jgi:hypothetical protein
MVQIVLYERQEVSGMMRENDIPVTNRVNHKNDNNPMHIRWSLPDGMSFDNQKARSR